MILTEKIRTARDRKIRYRYHAHAPERVFGRRRASDREASAPLERRPLTRRTVVRPCAGRRRDGGTGLSRTPPGSASCHSPALAAQEGPKAAARRRRNARNRNAPSASARSPAGIRQRAGGFPRGRILKSLRNVPVPSESEKPSTATSKTAFASKDGTGSASAMAMDPMLYAGLQADEAGFAFLERRMDSRCLPASIDVTPRRRRTRWGRRPS